MTTAPATDQPTPPALLSRTQKLLIGVVVTAVVVIATLGFAGSYTAVSALADRKGFGWFANAFPAAVDSGIIAFLALDLLLTWLRIPYPLLRYAAWLLTAATVAFNAATAWPDPLGVGMHAIIPVLFVVCVEAARHAVGRVADITADKHHESPPLTRWLLAPIPTFILWRRMRLWDIRSYEQVITLQREVRVYRARLKSVHGRRWRTKAQPEELLALTLAADGMSITDALALPETEAQKRTEAEAKLRAELTVIRTEAEAEAKRIAARTEAEAEAIRRTEAEAKRESEAKRIRTEAAIRTEAFRVAEANRILAAETEAKLAAIQAQRAEAEALSQARQRKAQAEADQAQRSHQERQAVLRRAQEAEAEAKRIIVQSRIRTEVATGAEPVVAPEAAATRTETAARPNPKPAEIGGRRSSRQTEIEAVLALITTAGDPKAVSLESIKADFGLKHAAAWDRLSTARTMWAQAQAQSEVA